ncbi:MAG: flavodoxin domain-containing protein [Candidatus Woesebacteria bacterium]|jgi:flavodoxin I
MSKNLILYGTMTGNTEQVAQSIYQELKKKDTEIKNVNDMTVADLLAYDTLILGAPTWDDGELLADFQEFLEEAQAKKIQLKGKNLAIFGLGDSSYPKFCKSADILERMATKLGGKSIIEKLRIDGFPDEERNVKNLKQWLDKLVKKI